MIISFPFLRLIIELRNGVTGKTWEFYELKLCKLYLLELENIYVTHLLIIINKLFIFTLNINFQL